MRSGHTSVDSESSRIEWLRGQAAYIVKWLRRNSSVVISTIIACMMFTVTSLPFLIVWASEGRTATAHAIVVPASLGAVSAPIEAVDESWGTVPEPEAPDPAVGLLRRIAWDDYIYNDDVAIGRFLDEFSSQAPSIEHLDFDNQEVLDRGVDWVRTITTYRTDDDPEPQRVRLRMVRRDGEWLLEHMKFLPEERP